MQHYTSNMAMCFQQRKEDKEATNHWKT